MGDPEASASQDGVPEGKADPAIAVQLEDTSPDYILDAVKVVAEYDSVLRAMSPPCKLTPTVAVRLLMAIRSGAHYETACAKARISYSAFVSWRNRAEDEGESSPFTALMQAVKLAEADAELESLQDVRVAAKNPKCWAAGMTFLERRHPDRWRRPDAAPSVQVNVGIAIGLQATEAERRALVPRVVIEQIAPENAQVVQAGHHALSPAAESAIQLSPEREMAVTGDDLEAKATPNRGVSPPNVA